MQAHWCSVLNLLLVILLLSCGKGFDDEKEDLIGQRSGQFLATLSPLNKKFGIHRGWVRITIADDQFWARVRLDGKADRRTPHSQFIMTLGRCPTMDDDFNHDGILDYYEASRRAGKMLVPLDGNLNSQLRGIDNFKSIRKPGFYFYSRAGSIRRMILDLRADDSLRDDEMVKLRSDENLDLDRRVMMVFGVSEDVDLPTSVRSFGGYPAQTTVPVACGAIRFDPLFSVE